MKMKKCLTFIIICSCIFTSFSLPTYANTEKTTTGLQGAISFMAGEEYALADTQLIKNGEVIIYSISNNDVDTPPIYRVGRHYNVKEEIVSDRRSNEYVYPVGKNSTTATLRAFCYSEKHYVVYRKRVGDPDYKVKLYDEYHTTWHGEYKVNGEWKKHPSFPKKSEISRERSPLVELIGDLL